MLIHSPAVEDEFLNWSDSGEDVVGFRENHDVLDS